MPTCPICAKPLETTRQREGVYYHCQVCDGRAVTVSQIRHVLGERVAMKLLRLMKLSRRETMRHCPFCDKLMQLLNMQDPQLELEACRACNAVWFDAPTYASLPQLAFESTSTIAMQATELIALERLKELKERQERERKEAKKKKRVHRISENDDKRRGDLGQRGDTYRCLE
jgi:Zn-finger nucleic acid-binding protein